MPGDKSGNDSSSTHSHHHHGLKSLFKRDSNSSSDGGKESGSSHTGLSKLFHHSDDHTHEAPRRVRRSSTLSSTKPGGSQRHLGDKPQVKLSRAETLAHVHHINKSNANRVGHESYHKSTSNPSSRVGSHQAEKIKYNPFGVNNETTEHPNASFYMQGGSSNSRILNNPIADPNDYLPEDLKEEHINLLDDFEIDMHNKTIGDGGSSEVRIINACHHKKELYALKKFTVLNKESDADFYQRVAKEYVISKRASKSRHVIDVYSLVRIQSYLHMSRGWGFVIEYCGYGDLFSMITRSGWKTTGLSEKYCLFKQIAYGVKFLHDIGIAHRDLKPENILLDNNGLAKICDFGVSDYGNETEGDTSSPIKLSTAFVGSPPYSSPEVMKIKEVNSSEVKNWAYDPYKMDCWSLGMLLFCIVYSTIPFGAATPNDHGYRDYKFNHDRFSSDHPNFKNGIEQSKGPGSEFKWASQFHSQGAARVAWKLCDPSPSRRYSIENVFADSWFSTLEMCLYEHPDQDVDPIVTHASNSSSAHNSRTTSRKNTLSSSSEELHTPVRSMLDCSGMNDYPAHSKYGGLGGEHRDDHSIRSASSLTDSPVANRAFRYANSSNSIDESTNSIQKKMDRLDVTEEDKDEAADNASGKKRSGSGASSHDISIMSNDNSKQASLKNQGSNESNKKYPMLRKTLKSNTMMHLDKEGVCDLGYRIKKHNHLDVSMVGSNGSVSRRR
ncbi:Piso0_002475 [Millerozyma farinosa CBS 7064]|uniref:non-specific serine/threonine protein kinase n=1 Tax=Pichia sorbitophila (strain ATCC MYA-4447 / BCRC 22081 / CBS 7064 / NBRC 10061 / NRRL Y-12695) TaxID=559304 RepID=G8YF54_PICSO|nr:Piso0_002475 [Millerozyma farinosa CBS 7064]